MISLALTLLLTAAQPGDDGPVLTRRVVPSPSAAAVEDAKQKAEAERRATAARSGTIDWEFRPDASPPPLSAKDTEEDWGIDAFMASQAPPTIKTEAEAREAANRAAIERAEQAGKEANAPPGAWPDEGKMRCKTTDNGFVCGNSDKALEPDSPSRKALDEIMKPN